MECATEQQTGKTVVCLVSLGGADLPNLGEIGGALARRLGGCVVDARPFAFEGARGGFTWAEVDAHATELDGKALLAALPDSTAYPGVGLLSGGARGAVGAAARVEGAPSVAAALAGLAQQGSVVVIEPAPRSVPEGALWVGVAGQGAHLWFDLPARALALAQASAPSGASCLVLLGRGPRAWDDSLAELCSRRSLLEVVRVERAWRRRTGAGLVAAKVAGWAAQAARASRFTTRVTEKTTGQDADGHCVRDPVSVAARDTTRGANNHNVRPVLSWLPGGAASPQRRERHQARRTA